MEWLSLLLFFLVVAALLAGYPVAFTLAGVSLIFASVAALFGHFDMGYLAALPNRVFGTMNNETLIAVPLFIYMGLVLERARIADDLLETLGMLFGRVRGGFDRRVRRQRIGNHVFARKLRPAHLRPLHPGRDTPVSAQLRRSRHPLGHRSRSARYP